MSYVEISGDPEAMMAAFDDDLSEMLDQANAANADYLAEIMRQLTPVRTGETQASIDVFDEGEGSYAVGSDNPVFGYLDEGTQGGVDIYPVTKQALHWHDILMETSQTEFFAKHVVQGSIQAMNITENALDLAEPVMDANMELYMEAAWERAAAEAYGIEGGE